MRTTKLASNLPRNLVNKFNIITSNTGYVPLRIEVLNLMPQEGLVKFNWRPTSSIDSLLGLSNAFPVFVSIKCNVKSLLQPIINLA